MRSNHQDIPVTPTASGSAPITSKLLESLAPSSPLSRGDHKLERAREIAQEFEHVISEHDRFIIEEKITL
jgi:hypothetical protein